ncbi:LptA/OstA family protein [Selenomonas sp. TAMA-11512]|uniref:LptA/OstA family protein n=1 Tax=Selenomonas sp. TAMA-11512 TaxID=3095337 RepID=UPI0030D362E1
MKNRWILAVALGCLAFHPLSVSMGAPEKNNSAQSALRGDSVSYDSTTGVLEAEGDVLLTQGETSIAGQKAKYNTKTRQGEIHGNVIAVREDLRMTSESAAIDGDNLSATGSVHAVQRDMTLKADIVRTAGKNRYLAEGNVYGTQADKTFAGPVIDYDQAGNYVLAASGGTITSVDGTFSANHMEGWFSESRYKGVGNAHIVSPSRNFEGGGDVADYYGQADATGRARCILDGNAWAYQDNNFVSGNHLTLYLSNNTPVVENK